MAFIDDAVREQLFQAAPATTDVWVGDVARMGEGREIVPVRFASLDFLVLFVSPHSEAGYDDALLLQSLDTLGVQDFIPARQSRMIKFCRADALVDANPVKPENWQLPDPMQIFQFGQTLADVVLLYVGVVPHIEQFMFLPASTTLGRLYNRTFKGLTKKLDKPFLPILPSTGVLHAYQRA